MPSAILRVAAALDEPALLEIVEDADEMAPVVAEGVGDLRLRLRGSSSSRARIVWSYMLRPALLEGLDHALLDREADPLGAGTSGS